MVEFPKRKRETEISVCLCEKMEGKQTKTSLVKNRKISRKLTIKNSKPLRYLIFKLFITH